MELSSNITFWQWTFAICAGLIIGINKAGIRGIGVLFAVFMALAFDAKVSTAVVLPLLIVGDIFAVIYYNRHTQWKYFISFLPWMILGVVLGAQVGNLIPTELFRYVLGAIIFSSVIMIIWWDKRASKEVPNQWWFAGIFGILAGMATMIGNVAGPLANIFFLAMRLPKNQFIGTASWVFFIINVFKVPFHVFAWKTMSWDTIQIDLKLLPVVFIGLIIGVQLVKYIHERLYRQLILILTAIGAILIFIR